MEDEVRLVPKFLLHLAGGLVGVPVYIGGYVVILTDWLPISIGLHGWFWAFMWIWLGALAASVALSVLIVILLPFLFILNKWGLLVTNPKQ